MPPIRSITRRTPTPKKWRASTIRCLLVATTLFTVVLWVTVALFGFDSVGNNDNNGDNDNDPAEIRGNTNEQQQQQQQQPQHDAAIHTIPTPRATIAYAVSLTSCGVTSDRHDNIRNGGHSSDPSFHEGAAVLKHSIHLSSIRNYHESKSLFDYEMIAFVHPQAQSCSSIFASLGYTVQLRETPFNVTSIRKQFLRDHIVKSGCCGEKEYLKLYAYALDEERYPIVVHLDLDSLILKPLDDLFWAMLDDDGGGGGGGKEGKEARSRVQVMHDKPLPPKPKPIDAYFTRDYNMVNPGHKHVGVQGGFLIVKPNMDAFNEYVSIVLEGDFHQGSGWEGKGYGGYFGAQQIQGVCSYYYDYKHPGTAVELDKCYYNVMADGPRQEKTNRCRDGKDTCRDCREMPVEEIYSVHFTLCSKPWHCPAWVGQNSVTKDICAKFHGEWFRIREDLEKDGALREGGGREYVNPRGGYRPDVFRGYCKSNGERGYIPIGGV